MLARRGLLFFFAFVLLAITIVSGAIGGVVGFMAARSIVPAPVAVSPEPILARAAESVPHRAARLACVAARPYFAGTRIAARLRRQVSILSPPEAPCRPS